MATITIAIDVMGGDVGLPVTLPASLEVLRHHPDLHLILVGDELMLKDALRSQSYDSSRLTIRHASQRVEMDESPALALRNKKDSSMRVAINLVKEGSASACVSAGNTGALMATARFVLKTIPGIDRPAIISAFPTRDPHKNVRMLDLGANVDSSPGHLVQFAVMASVLTEAIDNKPAPGVHLLNIGAEDIKGNELVEQTAKLLVDSSLVNYRGYIEGDAIFDGQADIVVCDGFVGNVALKTSEGVSVLVSRMVKEAFMRNIFTKLIGLLVKPILKSSFKRIDPARYNGATLIGLQGVVVKSHGGATQKAFMNAIEEAIINAKKNVPERIRHEIMARLNPSSTSSQHG